MLHCMCVSDPSNAVERVTNRKPRGLRLRRVGVVVDFDQYSATIHTSHLLLESTHVLSKRRTPFPPSVRSKP